MDTSLQSIGDVALAQSDSKRFSSNLVAGGNVDKASKEFEGMFISQMLQPMFEGLNVDSEFGGGHGEEVMRGFLIQEYGKVIAKSGGLGIGPMVKTQMIHAQEMADKAKGGTNAAAQ